MPKAAEKALRKTAKKRGYGEKKTKRYVYGGLRKAGWKPQKEGR